MLQALARNQLAAVSGEPPQQAERGSAEDGGDGAIAAVASALP